MCSRLLDRIRHELGSHAVRYRDPDSRNGYGEAAAVRFAREC